MSGFHLGPFEAEEMIAMGGMGDIWIGNHTEQDVLVAIKVIRRNSSDILDFLTVFRREVRAVAQLDHPGIIRLFDIGELSESAAAESEGAVEAGNPYLVMEYLERGSLESLELPLPWAQTHEILSATLRALAHAHARGITHRDLKPGNILLADASSGSPIRLTDFGIAFSFNELQAKEIEGRTVGTPTHMAPEQFMAEWRDFGPWTDLYSLGCIAYELAAGRIPFDYHDVLKLGTAHIKDKPPRLVCPPDYPDGFPRWVSQLLEKEPEYRYRRCADALADLNALDAPSTPSGRAYRSDAVPDWRAPAESRSSFRLIGTGLRLFGLRPVPIVDRDSVRDALWDLFRLVSSTGQTRCLVLEGGAGTGKSRLAEWFYERTHEMGLANCLRADFDRSVGREIALSRMLASAWSCIGATEDELRDRVEKILAPTSLTTRTSRKATAEFLALAAMGDDYRPGSFYTFQGQSRRFNALLEALTSVFSRRPIVIWFDDVHWGAEGLQFVQYVLDRSQTDPQQIMFVITVRDDLIVNSKEASGLLRELCDDEAVKCEDLGPLSETDSRTLVNSMLYLEGDLAETVRTRSAGNPLYATQLVGDWVSRGILEAGTSGFVMSGPRRPRIPDDVHSLWVQRLERLLDESIDTHTRFQSPEEQRTQMQIALELAAALGGRVDVEEWRSVTSRAGVSEPGPVLEALLASRLARLSEGSWSFSHSMLRDSIERISRERRRWVAHNRLCADMLEERRPIPHWGDSERIGRYRFDADQYDLAIEPLMRGARERRRLEEYAAALDLVDLCERSIDELKLTDDTPSRLEALLLRADIKCTRQELGAAEALAGEVISLAAGDDLTRYRGAALLILARVRQRFGSTRMAVDYYGESEALLRAAGTKHELADCLSEKASALLDLGRLDDAWDAFNEAQEIFEDAGQLLPWAQNQLGLARVALRQGDPDHALTLCRRVRAFARREGLNLVEAEASMIFAEVQIAEGATEKASESLDRSIELLEQLGMIRQELHPRLLKILMLLEESSVETAQAALAQLWSAPDLNAPWVSTLLMSCLGLAIDVDGSPGTYHSALSEVTELISDSETLPLDVVRCLQLAVERAREMGYPERASQVRELIL